jgi:hypothetical protein
VGDGTGRASAARFLLLFFFCVPAFGQGGSSITPSGAPPPIVRGPAAPEATLPEIDPALARKCRALRDAEKMNCLRSARGAESAPETEPKARGSTDREGPGSTGMGSAAGSSR